MDDKNTQKNTVVISVKNVSKQFSIPHERISTISGAFVNMFKKNAHETFYALKDISFEVKRGEFFGILGRNGSGKSTLLKILAGVYTTDKGHVKIDGRVSPFLELGIGFNPELSGRDNIYLNATVLGLTEKEIDDKFDSIVAFSELERFIDQKLKNYSSGMQVRLAFAVSIHANREILLMDEVLAVGDANFQSKCLREFTKYKEQGKTVILVTHDIGTVQRYCDRAMLLRNGEVAMIGTALEVGNEYIYQNMSDEEKRIIKEKEAQKINIVEKKVSGVDEINADSFLDKNIIRFNSKNTELTSIEKELNNALIQLDSKNRELREIYSCRGWNVIISLRRISASFFPYGSIRRGAAKIFWKVLRNSVGLLLKIARKIWRSIKILRGSLVEDHGHMVTPQVYGGSGNLSPRARKIFYDLTAASENHNKNN